MGTQPGKCCPTHTHVAFQPSQDDVVAHRIEGGWEVQEQQDPHLPLVKISFCTRSVWSHNCEESCRQTGEGRADQTASCVLPIARKPPFRLAWTGRTSWTLACSVSGFLCPCRPDLFGSGRTCASLKLSGTTPDSRDLLIMSTRTGATAHCRNSWATRLAQGQAPKSLLELS